MRRLKLIVGLLILSLSIIVTPVRAATWTAEATTLDLPVGRGAFLAPDGSRFAYLDDGVLCLYTIAGEKQTCTTLDLDPFSGNHIDPESIRWSPDSTKIAFSENVLRDFSDSDIWILDTNTNTLSDLTPAPNRETKFVGNKDPNVVFTLDIAPQWSADSQFIYFIRSTFSERLNDGSIDFFRVKVSSGETEEVAPIETCNIKCTYFFALSPDGSRIAYNRWFGGQEENEGTWFLEAGNPEAIFAAAPVEKTAPVNIQFSPDGLNVLSIGVDREPGRLPLKSEFSPFYTLAISSGSPQYLSVNQYVIAAGWGIEGATLAYSTYDYSQSHPETDGLYITDIEGNNGEMVLAGRFFAPSHLGHTPLIWATNNTILLLRRLVDGEAKLVVVRLTRS